jgi:hypothetical protein
MKTKHVRIERYWDRKTLGQLRNELARLEKSIEHRNPPSILHGRVDELREMIAVAEKAEQKSWVQIHDLNCDPPRVYVAKCRDDAHDGTDASVYDEVMRHDDTITMGRVIGCPFRNAS